MAVVLVCHVDLAAFQHHGMAQRNDGGGVFGGHDACDAGDFGNRAFGGLPVRGLDLRIDFGREENAGFGDGGAAGGLLGGDIYHVGVSVFGEVGEGHGVSFGWMDGFRLPFVVCRAA